jgi:streptogramin lyase
MAAIAIVAIVALASFVLYETYFQAPNCPTLPGGAVVRTQTSTSSFGPIKEYYIPGQERFASAVTTAPDGSVWFVEQDVPGVGHLYPRNGTLVEYSWMGYNKPFPPFCGPRVSSSGIALWGGKVWAADQFGNAIVGVNPADGSMTLLNTTSKVQPYWLAVGPDGNLWFSSNNVPSYIGRIFPNDTISLIGLSGIGTDSPLQLEFVNSSLAFMAAVNLAANSTTGACICDGHIYSFDPSTSSSNIRPILVGGNYKLTLPTSVSYSAGRVWVAQHGASSVVSYDFASKIWIKYPTSRVPWTNITLPYFVDANGPKVWFNEHYANKLAFIDTDTGTLTEISASNPPASSYQGIQNDEFFTRAAGGVWFTSLSGNYVGFLDSTYSSSYQIGLRSSDKMLIAPGGNGSVTVSVSGTWNTSLRVSVSDSESYSSVPNLIHMIPTVSQVPAGNNPYTFSIKVNVDHSVKLGSYTLAVTLTSGGIQQTAYLFLSVD